MSSPPPHRMSYLQRQGLILRLLTAILSIFGTSAFGQAGKTELFGTITDPVEPAGARS